jgi:hypothetical protein
MDGSMLKPPTPSRLQADSQGSTAHASSAVLRRKNLAIN